MYSFYEKGNSMKDNIKIPDCSGGMYLGPMVYFGMFAMPLPMFEQMFMVNGTDKNKMQMNMEKQFKLPYPEDDTEN